METKTLTELLNEKAEKEFDEKNTRIFNTLKQAVKTSTVIDTNWLKEYLQDKPYGVTLGYLLDFIRDQYTKKCLESYQETYAQNFLDDFNNIKVSLEDLADSVDTIHKID